MDPQLSEDYEGSGVWTHMQSAIICPVKGPAQ
uniref:Uncharacterized protein n=1 Tax=Anguilla anguilla TaxID=7936 RepID=A0A0E9QNY0_ANGAN